MLRLIAIGASGALVGYSALYLIAPSAEVSFGLTAMLMGISLMAFGTMLGRVDKAEGYVLAAGAVALINAIGLFASGRAPFGDFAQLFLTAGAVAAIVSGGMLRRKARAHSSDPGS